VKNSTKNSFSLFLLESAFGSMNEYSALTNIMNSSTADSTASMNASPNIATNDCANPVSATTVS